MGGMKNSYRSLVGIPEGENIEDVCADGTLILKYISKR
jgi:hypothetical protein